jgi:hypothetical protein
MTFSSPDKIQIEVKPTKSELLNLALEVLSNKDNVNKWMCAEHNSLVGISPDYYLKLTGDTQKIKDLLISIKK